MRRLLLFLLIPTAAMAQLRPFVQGTMGNDGELGYKVPSFTASIGAEYRALHALVIGSVTYGGGKKDVDGHTLNGRLEANRSLYSSFMAGGGVSCGEVHTSLYRKGACRPFVQLVLDEKVRTSVGYLFRGSDKFNELEGLYIGALYEWNDHFRTGLDFGRYDFVETDTRKPRTGRTWAVKAGWIF